jgi:hypothetical protein
VVRTVPRIMMQDHSKTIYSGPVWIWIWSKVARRLSREAKPSAVYSSDLRRASETAQIIATACGVSNVCVSHSSSHI